MREAQAAAIEGRDGPDLRVALTELREQTSALTRLAGAALEEVGRPPETPELTARLAAIAGSAAAIDELVAGILGSGEAAHQRPVRRPRAGRADPAPRRTTAPTATKAKPAAASPKVDAAAQRERQRLLARAEKEHEASMRDLARADAALAEAEAAVEKATAELARLTERRDEAAGKRDDAADRLDRTKAALDEARDGGRGRLSVDDYRAAQPGDVGRAGAGPRRGARATSASGTSTIPST